jgi:hypothetical protein
LGAFLDRRLSFVAHQLQIRYAIGEIYFALRLVQSV